METSIKLDNAILYLRKMGYEDMKGDFVVDFSHVEASHIDGEFGAFSCLHVLQLDSKITDDVKMWLRDELEIAGKSYV